MPSFKVDLPYTTRLNRSVHPNIIERLSFFATPLSQSIPSPTADNLVPQVHAPLLRVNLGLFRIFPVIVLLSLTIACGSKRPVTRTVPPPPPPVQPQPEEQPTAKKPPEKTFPSAKAPAPENPEDEFAEYKDAKPIWSEVGYASWYGPPYHNRRGANGEIYNENAMTAAHKTLPMGSVVRVTNLKTGSQTMLRITDRGPFVSGRIIDVSQAAARELDISGLTQVCLNITWVPERRSVGQK